MNEVVTVPLCSLTQFHSHFVFPPLYPGQAGAVKLTQHTASAHHQGWSGVQGHLSTP